MSANRTEDEVSARTVEPLESELESPISRAEALACDEALFGLEQAELAELAELGGSASLRSDLQLVAARLSLRNAGRQESLPNSLRAKIQAQAFEHFDGVVKPKSPTATTTGANVVEVDSNVVELRPRRSRWVAVAAAAALLLTVGGASLVRPSPTPASAPKVDVAERLLRGTKGGTSAELRLRAESAHFALSSDLGAEQLAGQQLWLQVGPVSQERWLKLTGIPLASGGRVQMDVPFSTAETVRGFAVTSASTADASQPALERAIVLGMVNE
jgi:hypothetical protein